MRPRDAKRLRIEKRTQREESFLAQLNPDIAVVFGEYVRRTKQGEDINQEPFEVIIRGELRKTDLFALQKLPIEITLTRNKNGGNFSHPSQITPQRTLSTSGE
jgi:hypothetical protein